MEKILFRFNPNLSFHLHSEIKLLIIGPRFTVWVGKLPVRENDCKMASIHFSGGILGCQLSVREKLFV
jgi:hypothetical protein